MSYLDCSLSPTPAVRFVCQHVCVCVLVPMLVQTLNVHIIINASFGKMCVYSIPRFTYVLCDFTNSHTFQFPHSRMIHRWFGLDAIYSMDGCIQSITFILYECILFPHLRSPHKKTHSRRRWWWPFQYFHEFQSIFMSCTICGDFTCLLKYAPIHNRYCMLARFELLGQ